MNASPAASTLTSWRASPWQSRPRRTFAGAVLIAVFSVVVGLAAGDWMWGAFASVGLLLATLPAFVPTLYVADDRVLRIHGPLRSREVQLKDITRVGVEPDGAYLVRAHGKGVTVLLDSPQRGAWLQARVREVQAASSASVGSTA